MTQPCFSAATCIAVLALAAGCAANDLAAQPWTLKYEDSFSRATLGTDWLILRGDWHINKEGRLQIQRSWSSHSFLMSTVSLRGLNVKAEMVVVIPSEQAGRFGVFLQAGAYGWGGGGVDDRAGIELNGVPAAELAKLPADKQSALNVTTDDTHRVVITLADGKWTAEVDGKVAARGEAQQGRSLVNNSLQFSACPGGVVDNLKLYTAPMARPLPALNDAPPGANRRATVFAEKFLDPAKPDCGFQEAIDSLPPGGGVVVLPKGEFLLRRFLEVRSHTTLTGQGPETVLKVPDATAVEIGAGASEGGVHKVVLKGEHDFRKGDSFSYDTCWGHPINAKGPGQRSGHMLGGDAAPENRLLVLDVRGDTLVVNSPPPAERNRGKRLVRFFPPICSFESEFAEVKDLTIIGPQNNPAKVGGGFQTNPVTFGATSNPRFTRLVVRGWPGDGLSAQGCDDGRFLDSTFSGTARGMHPGTTTLRTMVARNYSVDNGGGLFFCWYNSNGIYYRNFLKDFTGYPDSGDVFNTLAFNRLTAPMAFTVGYNGSFFGNALPGLQIYGHAKADPRTPNGRTYEVPPRYFAVGFNTAPEITVFQYVRGNAFAANRAPDGAPAKVLHRADPKDAPLGAPPPENVLANDAPVKPISGMPEAITRTTPEPPPALRGPVVDARAAYDPAAPDLGFQRALDALAAGGGTLRLPGGRYALQAPLRVPSKVTLTGYGTGTVLLPARRGMAVIELLRAEDAVVRDLAIEGDWTASDDAAPALRLVDARKCAVIALDIRGCAGGGISATGASAEIEVRDCRALRAGGTGFEFIDCAGLRVETSSAVGCRTGVAVVGGRGALLAGNIAALNQGPGYALQESAGALLLANNANNNLCDGIQVVNAPGAVVAGNTCANNNQRGGPYAGIRLAAGARDGRVLCNDCGDEQLYATQLVGIREEAGAERNEIRFNSTATVAVRRGHEKDPSLLCAGNGSTVADNWTETLLPAQDSIEAIEWKKAHPK
jgi:hypothetical protein